MSRAVSNILLDKEILLESGTNELEVLVFTVGPCCFGINVAKVREVLPRQPITCLPRAHPSVRGVFRLRDLVVPCVSLLDHLGLSRTSDDAEGTLVLTDFNGQQTAFLVDAVERIHRLSWENVLAAPSLVAMAHTPITAVARIEQRMIVMLDFEMVIDQVTDASLRQQAVPNPHNLPRESLRLLLADDSPTVRQAVAATLKRSGYTELQVFENGAEAWQWIERSLAEGGRAAVGDLLISDVEMPQIDGFHLTRRIKEHSQLADLPVLLYSSIVTPDNHKKGAAVGADAQVSKPELAKVVEIADELIIRTRGKNFAAPATVATAPAASVPIASPPQTADTDGARAAMPISHSAERTYCGRAPRGMDPALWATFHQELSRRVQQLVGLARMGADRGPNDEQRREALRTLHTIKSASMVLPCEPISRCTHLVESLLDVFTGSTEGWPEQAFSAYTGWLELVAGSDGDPDVALGHWTSIEAQLSEAIEARQPVSA